MASSKIQVVQNDNNHKLIFIIRKDGRIESLLGAIVQLQFINRANGNIMKRECVITDASAAVIAARNGYGAAVRRSKRRTYTVYRATGTTARHEYATQ
jgi:hypothetical protein